MNTITLVQMYVLHSFSVQPDVACYNCTSLYTCNIKADDSFQIRRERLCTPDHSGTAGSLF